MLPYSFHVFLQSSSKKNHSNISIHACLVTIKMENITSIWNGKSYNLIKKHYSWNGNIKFDMERVTSEMEKVTINLSMFHNFTEVSKPDTIYSLTVYWDLLIITDHGVQKNKQYVLVLRKMENMAAII